MLKPLLFSLAILGISLPSCHTIPTPPAPAETKSGPAYYAADLEFKGRIEAQSLAANFAAATLPDSNGKIAVQGTVGIISTLTAGTATQKQKDEAMVPVAAALAGKLVEATNGWNKAQTDAAAFKLRIDQLEDQVKQERVAAAAELTRQLQQARDDERSKAEAQIRAIVSWLFFGFGLVCEIAAAIIFFYAGSVPQLGPKAALLAGSAGVVSIGTGIAVLELLSHPTVVWWGIGIVLALVAGALALVYSNHQHAVAAGQTPTTTVVPPTQVPAKS